MKKINPPMHSKTGSGANKHKTISKEVILFFLEITIRMIFCYWIAPGFVSSAAKGFERASSAGTFFLQQQQKH